MWRIVLILILTSFSLTSFSQKGDSEISKLTVANRGDSSLLAEKYEIAFSKEKVFRITPVVNYLHIKRTKFRTKVSLSKNDWKEITRLVLTIDFEKLEQYSQTSDQSNIYVIERSLNNDEENLVLRLTEESMTKELKTLLEIIRSSK